MMAYIDLSSRRIIDKDLVDRIIDHLRRIFLKCQICEFIIVRIT